LTTPIEIINSDSCSVPLGWDKRALEIGVRSRIMWYPARASPHILCAGQSGSGKTMWLKLFASRCVRDVPNCELFLADPKRIDFTFAVGAKRAWFGGDCSDALEAFQDSLISRVNGIDTSSHWKIFIFDELAAFTLLQADRKRVTALQSTLASILLLGRGVRHVLVVGVQKALMEFFGSGGRAQFGTVLVLGKIDREQKNMLFPYEEFSEVNARGQFYVSTDGEGLKRGQTPAVQDLETIHALIRKGLTRN
jgi:hypothetical protein